MTPIKNLATEKRYLYMIILSYAISFGLSLVTSGLFWDDWVWADRNLDFFRTIGSEMGMIWFQYWAYFVNSHIILGKLLVFFLNLANGLLIYKMMKKHFTAESSFIITLFFLVIPVNYGRTVLCVSQYSLSLFLFLVAFYLVLLNFSGNRLIVRIIALLLFFLSFEMSSLLSLYVVVALYVWWQGSRFKNFWHTVVKYLDFIGIAMLYAFLKTFVLSTSGNYEGYNSFDTTAILISPLKIIQIIYYVTINLAHSITSYAFTVPAIIVLLPVVYIYVFHPMNLDEIDLKDTYILPLSFILLVFGALPYAIADKTPNLTNWDSRHAILLAPGISFFIYGILTKLKAYFTSIVFIKILLSIFFISCIIFNFSVGRELLYKNHKQQALQILLNNEVIRNNHTFLFNDQSIPNNILISGTIDSFYIFSSMFHKIYGDESRLMISDSTQYEKIKQNALTYSHLRTTGWIEEPITHTVTLSMHHKYGPVDEFKLLIYSLFNKTKYRNLLMDIYFIEVSLIS